MARNKAVIIGTAASWVQTPWHDTSALLCSLNDAYRMEGFVRADEWYDLHPMDHFMIVKQDQGPLYPHQVPAGHYVRPHGYLEWLAAREGPLWLHPDYLAQRPDTKTWKHARTFPRHGLATHFGQYFTSTPQWMMAHLMRRGFNHIIITGIHLATEQEYRLQRPGLENFMGRFLGAGKMTTTVTNGMRRYETEDGVLELPESSPVLNAEFQYAFEPRPEDELRPLEWERHKYRIKRDRTVGQLRDMPWWRNAEPVQRELKRIEATEADINEQFDRATVARQWR